jgi:hypothetical protein
VSSSTTYSALIALFHVQARQSRATDGVRIRNHRLGARYQRPRICGYGVRLQTSGTCSIRTVLGSTQDSAPWDSAISPHGGEADISEISFVQTDRHATPAPTEATSSTRMSFRDDEVSLTALCCNMGNGVPGSPVRRLGGGARGQSLCGMTDVKGYNVTGIGQVVI